MLNIRVTQSEDEKELIRLIARFRQSLARVRGKDADLDRDAAREELSEYQQKEYPIYVAEEVDQGLIGYIVCRVEDDVVWAESLFVDPAHRRQGIGSSLYEKAESLADELGNDTLYNWVDPDHKKIIRFLKKRGYNVLNLIELRRAHANENMKRTIRVGNHEFNY